MALNWEWDECFGEAVHHTGYYTHAYLYRGNALWIELCEHAENGEGYWDMHSFLLDTGHFKNCLKGDFNPFGDWDYVIDIDKFTERFKNYKTGNLSKDGKFLIDALVNHAHSVKFVHNWTKELIEREVYEEALKGARDRGENV